MGQPSRNLDKIKDWNAVGRKKPMNTIKYTARKNKLGLDSARVYVTSGNAEYIQLEFTLDDDWAGLTVSVIYSKDGASPMSALLVGNLCTVPWELTESPGTLTLGLVGIDRKSVCRERVY